MKIKKALLFMILFMIGLIGVNQKQVMGEEAAKKGGVSLSPAYMDLGSMKEGTTSFTISVMNEGKSVHLKAKIDNAEGLNITIKPKAFTLGKKEKKKITVTLKNDGSMKTGAYDLSIAFLTTRKEHQSVIAYGTNSLRLVFQKEGLLLATCNVEDMGPEQKMPFYSILGNFYTGSKTAKVSIAIKNKKTGDTVLKQRENINMKPYPDSGFYGRIDTPALSKPWEYGDYIYRLTANIEGETVLVYTTEFNVGDRKGKLISVSTKNVQKGEPAGFEAVIKNIGTQKLPVSVHIEVKSEDNYTIYTDKKTNLLRKNAEGTVAFNWPTKYTKLGRYSIDYIVVMGDQTEQGTLYYEVTMPCWIIFLILGILTLVMILILILFEKKKKNILHNTINRHGMKPRKK